MNCRKTWREYQERDFVKTDGVILCVLVVTIAVIVFES